MTNVWDKIEQEAENAPEAGYRQLNYGKLTVTPKKRVWKTIDEKRKPVDSPFGKDDTVNANAGERIVLHFNVDIQEFNPSLDFSYERDVEIIKSRDEKNKTDWSEIVLPSLEKVFGKDWAKKFNDVYVEVEDVPQVNTKKGAEKVYSTISVLRAFKSREDCLAARDLTYKKQGEEATALAGEIPEAIKDSVRGLLSSLGSTDAVLKALESRPFGDYDPEMLLAASNPI